MRLLLAFAVSIMNSGSFSDGSAAMFPFLHYLAKLGFRINRQCPKQATYAPLRLSSER